MKPIVLVRMPNGVEFFVIDENTTAIELLNALLEMKNGEKILKELVQIRLEVDYSAQSP